MSTALGRQAATAAVKDAIGSRFAAVTTLPANRIDWTQKNFPKCMPLVHFDIAELREKRPGHLARVVTWLASSLLALLTVAIVNFIDTCVLVATVHGEPGLAILGSIALCATLIPIGGAAVFLYYRGSAESRGRETTVGRACAAVIAVVAFFFAIVPSGNLNGIVGFGTARFSA